MCFEKSCNSNVIRKLETGSKNKKFCVSFTGGKLYKLYKPDLKDIAKKTL